MGGLALAVVVAALVLGGGGKARASSRRPTKGPIKVYASEYPPGEGTPPGAWIVGFPGDPEIDELLLEMEELFLDAGVPPIGWTAEEITRMPKAPGQPVAIPPPGMWPNMIPTLALYVELREEMGVPLALRGYRPPDYNEAVGGEDRSLHQWFAALDVYPTSGEDRDLLGWEAAELFVDSDEEVGLGIYGVPPGNIHIDTGWRSRIWEDSEVYLDAL